MNSMSTALWTVLPCRARGDLALVCQLEADQPYPSKDLILADEASCPSPWAGRNCSIPCFGSGQIAFPKWPRPALAGAGFIDSASFTMFVINAVTIITFANASAPWRVKRVHGSYFNHWKLENASQIFNFFIIHPYKPWLAAAAGTTSGAFKL